MVSIVRKITADNDVSFVVHSYSIGDTIHTDLDLEHDGESLIDNEPISLNKEDLANLIQILIEAQNTECNQS